MKCTRDDVALDRGTEVGQDVSCINALVLRPTTALASWPMPSLIRLHLLVLWRGASRAFYWSVVQEEDLRAVAYAERRRYCTERRFHAGLGREAVRQGATTALGRMRTKERVTAEDLSQVAALLPQAWEIAAKALDVEPAELSTLISEGNADSDHVLPALAAELTIELNDSVSDLVVRLGEDVPVAWERTQLPSGGEALMPVPEPVCDGQASRPESRKPPTQSHRQPLKPRHPKHEIDAAQYRRLCGLARAIARSRGVSRAHPDAEEIVNEAFLRVRKYVRGSFPWERVRAYYAIAIRQVLADRARYDASRKRANHDGAECLANMQGRRAHSIEAPAMLREFFEKTNRRQGRVALCRFAGFTATETGQLLGISATTVERERGILKRRAAASKRVRD